MMDYYSDFPPPPESEIITNVAEELWSTLHFSLKKMKKIVKRVLNDMGGVSSLGSFTGYCVFGRKQLINNCIKYIKTNGTNFITFKSVVLIVLMLNQWYKYICHMRYQPEGVGYYEAEEDFNKFSLPPIGNKPLYTPIKTT